MARTPFTSLQIGLLAVLIIISAVFAVKYFYVQTYLRPSIAYVDLDVHTPQEIGLLGCYDNNLIIKNGNVGEWDENIREIGNVVYSPHLNKYMFFYSGYSGEYDQNNVFVGMAISQDGISWEKQDKIDLQLAAEDPYAVISEGEIYLFFEDKEEVPFRRVSLATSEDGIHWDIVKRGVINPVPDSSWQNIDVSSPVVVRCRDRWAMIYEGRGKNSSGMIGYAVSTNLIDWSQEEEPVFKARAHAWRSHWDVYIAPDDVVYADGMFIMTYHGFGKRNGWQSGLAASRDLVNWNRVHDYPIHPSSTLMLMQRGRELLFIAGLNETNDVRFWRPLRIHELERNPNK